MQMDVPNGTLALGKEKIAVSGERKAGLAQGLTLVFAQALPIMAVVTLTPALPKLFQTFGSVPHPELLIPSVLTLPSLCIALTAPLMGWIADKFGRRLLLLLALGGYSFSGVAPVFMDDLYSILIARAILGLSESGIVTVASTLIADYFGVRGRRQWLAVQSAVGAAAGTIMLALGGILADIDWRGPFVIYLLSFPIFIAAIVWLYEPKRAAPAKDEGSTAAGHTPFPWGLMAMIAIITFITSIIYYVEPLNFALVLTSKGVTSPSLVGIIISATSLAYIYGAFVYRRLSDQPITRLLAVAFLFTGLGMVGIGFGPEKYTVIASAFVHQVGAGMFIPALIGWGQGLLPLEHRGRGMGVWGSFFFIGMFAMPFVVSGATLFTGELAASIGVIGIAALVGALISAIGGASGRGPKASEVAPAD